MLVISRKPGEKVRIGDNVEIAILEISGSRVVLGIEAPREIAVRRVGPTDVSGDEEPSAMAEVAAPRPVALVETAATPVPRPFEYPSRATPESSQPRVKTPVVTVRRSRKIALPADGGTG